MVQIVEYIQGLLPGVASLLRTTGSVECVAEVEESVSFLVAVAEFAEQVHRLLIAGDGLDMLAEMPVDVTNAVQGTGFAMLIAALTLKLEGLMAAGESLGVVSAQCVTPSY